MKQFSFRLDRICRYRGYLEKKAQGELARARNEQRETEKAVNLLASERMELAEKCSDKLFSGMHVPLYWMYGVYLERLRMELEEAHGELTKAGEKVRAREKALLRESIKRKALDALRDLRRTRYIENMEREEQKLLDELVILRRGHKS
jgi:flagellar export protein FliJ